MANQLTDENILAALGGVKDPEIGRDLVSLGMIKDIKIEGERVAFSIVLTTPACPVRDNMKQWCEDAVRRLPWVKQVTIDMQATTATGRGAGSKRSCGCCAAGRSSSARGGAAGAGHGAIAAKPERDQRRCSLCGAKPGAGRSDSRGRHQAWAGGAGALPATRE